jgi:hypothetical protein
MTLRATSHHKDPSTLSVLTERKGRQAPSMSQLERLDTRHNSHWLMQCKRIRCHVCSTKTKKQERNSRVENATKGCVLHDISRYITPHCISEDQLTLKWKIRVHKCQQILPHTQMSVNITIVNAKVIFFSNVF